MQTQVAAELVNGGEAEQLVVGGLGRVLKTVVVIITNRIGILRDKLPHDVVRLVLFAPRTAADLLRPYRLELAFQVSFLDDDLSERRGCLDKVPREIGELAEFRLLFEDVVVGEPIYEVLEGLVPVKQTRHPDKFCGSFASVCTAQPAHRRAGLTD